MIPNFLCPSTLIGSFITKEKETNKKKLKKVSAIALKKFERKSE